MFDLFISNLFSRRIISIDIIRRSDGNSRFTSRQNSLAHTVRYILEEQIEQPVGALVALASRILRVSWRIFTELPPHKQLRGIHHATLALVYPSSSTISRVVSSLRALSHFPLALLSRDRLPSDFCLSRVTCAFLTRDPSRGASPYVDLAVQRLIVADDDAVNVGVFCA